MASRKIFCMQYFMGWHKTAPRTANISLELEPRPENKDCPNHSRVAAGGGPNPASCCSPLGWIVPGSSPGWKSLHSLSGCNYWIVMGMCMQLRSGGELWWWKSLCCIYTCMGKGGEASGLEENLMHLGCKCWRSCCSLFFHVWFFVVV